MNDSTLIKISWDTTTEEPPARGPQWLKKKTRGNKVTIDFDGRVIVGWLGHCLAVRRGPQRQLRALGPTFTAGGRKRHLLRKAHTSTFPNAIGIVLVNGMVRFADGTEAYALLEIDEASSGEHCGTAIFLVGGGMTWQDDEDFCEKLGKPSGDVFPYRYKYTGKVRAPSDHHIGSDGWSGGAA